MEYETVVGLEIHAELATKSKIFCSCTTEFGGEPNTHCCPVCAGMPGTLPVLNKKAVEYAVRAGLAMNCEIAHFSKLDRKNYFYPDLPKAYQISQYDLPLCRRGWVELGSGRRVGITRIHIEEDAGKLVHNPLARQTFVDYNRCGVPLIEIVSEPDMRSPAEAREYIEKVRLILLYAGVSDCRMEQGSLRADVNVSVRPAGQKALGTRTEMKNINSFRGIYRAVENEAQRQTDELESGGRVVQQTRRWDDAAGESTPMRSKEEADDYRYFPEPDVVPIRLTDEQIEKIRAGLPEMPDSRRKKYRAAGVSDEDARMLTSDRRLADFFEQAARLTGDPAETAKWTVGEMMRNLNERSLEPSRIPFGPEALAELLGLCRSGRLTAGNGKKLLSILFDEKGGPAELMKRHGLETVGDDAALDAAVDKALAENPKSVADYRAGKQKALGFLMGRCMRQFRGKADPAALRGKLIRKLKA